MDHAARVVETHISTLFFVNDRVYKSKKPVRNDFVDFTTIESRRDACHREVDLNRRLAPDVYLGVASITLDRADLDHVVVMRRLPQERRLSARLDDPDIDDDLRTLAHQMAAFHGRAARSPAIDMAASPATLDALWSTGIEQVATFTHDVLDLDDVARVGLLAREFVAGRHRLLNERIDSGKICDGHGDLQAEDVFVLDDGPRVLDCLEFDDQLRYGDVLGDVAFLAMDLERLGRRDLGDRFLDAYREFSASTWPDSLAHHYMAYRAHIRAKVTCLRHRQNADPESAALARALHDLALAHLEAARVRLILVGGSPGTGKSTVSRDLGDRLGAVVLSSDVVRDELFPRHPAEDHPFGDLLDSGRYEPSRVEAVYAEMLRRAEMLLEHGHSVVLDASWLDPSRRDRARAIAHATTSSLHELRCTCPDDIAAERVRVRTAAGGDASEATPEIAIALAEAALPWPEAVLIDTHEGAHDAVSAAESAVRDS